MLKKKIKTKCLVCFYDIKPVVFKITSDAKHVDFRCCREKRKSQIWNRETNENVTSMVLSSVKFQFSDWYKPLNEGYQRKGTISTDTQLHNDEQIGIPSF